MAKIPVTSRRADCDLEYLEDIHKAIIHSDIIESIRQMLKLEVSKPAATNSSDSC